MKIVASGPGLPYFQKVFQLQITKYIFKSISITFVNYFRQVAQNTKYF